MALPQALTEVEYFALDQTGDARLDFIDGFVVDHRQLVAMAGGTYGHSLVAANLIRALGNALQGHPCRVHGGELRVGLPKGNFVYPDALVVCGPPKLRPEGPSDTLENPTAVYEVLSPATESYDRGAKLDGYTSMPSVREVVFVRPDAPRVERFLRTEDGWRWEATVGLGTTLRTLEVELPMTALYEGVELSGRSS